MRPTMFAGAALAAALAAAGVTAAQAAPQKDIGKQEYQENCVTCHGAQGRGDGPMAELLKSKVPDLSVLTKNNGGVFPFSRVYEVIDGRQQVKSHGPREMPVWGRDYGVRAAPRYDDFPYDPEAAARARILSLIDYLYRLQAK